MFIILTFIGIMGKQIVCMLMYDNGEHAQKIKVQTKAPLQSRHIID